jgi:ATP-dependent RNA helicase DDX18/HAS1
VVWKEEKDNDDDDDGGGGRNEEGITALSVSSSRSRSTGKGSSSSTTSSSSSRDSFISGGRSLNTAVRHALAITAGEGGVSSDEDDDDDEEGGGTDVEDDEDEEEEGSRDIVVRTPIPRHNDAELIRADGNRFLAAAVDNYNAMVPVDSAIYEAYDHTFVTCPESLRFRFLYTFLKKNLNKKVVIFFSTTNSVRYHAALLDMFRIPVLTMHGDQRREKFVNRFFKFSDMDECILCTTDAAGRDLDIPPSVDWVVQFEPPDDPSEYILRVARISCDSDRVGRSLLFLNPGEKQGFLKYYHSASIPVSEFELPSNLAEVQSHIENAARGGSGRFLRRARDAYGSYLIAYASHGFRDVYNVHDLNKGDVAEAFGLVGGLAPRNDDYYDDDGFTVETGTVTEPEVGHGRIEPRSRKDATMGKRSQKDQRKTWMKGEKSWPHSQIKLHPNFKGSAVDAGYN